MTDVFADMQQMVGPHCWGAPDVTPFTRIGGLPHQCDVEAILKAASDAKTPAEARAGLFEAAQKAIAAVEEAGYRHYRAPDISIAGEVSDVYKADGPALIADGRLILNLWRPDEEER